MNRAKVAALCSILRGRRDEPARRLPERPLERKARLRVLRAEIIDKTRRMFPAKEIRRLLAEYQDKPAPKRKKVMPGWVEKEVGQIAILEKVGKVANVRVVGRNIEFTVPDLLCGKTRHYGKTTVYLNADAFELLMHNFKLGHFYGTPGEYGGEGPKRFGVCMARFNGPYQKLYDGGLLGKLIFNTILFLEGTSGAPHLRLDSIPLTEQAKADLKKKDAVALKEEKYVAEKSMDWSYEGDGDEDEEEE